MDKTTTTETTMTIMTKSHYDARCLETAAKAGLPKILDGTPEQNMQAAYVREKRLVSLTGSVSETMDLLRESEAVATTDKERARVAAIRDGVIMRADASYWLDRESDMAISSMMDEATKEIDAQ